MSSSMPSAKNGSGIGHYHFLPKSRCPLKVDNTALVTHQTCPSKYDLRIRQGWTSRGKSAALNAGGAIHAGLAVWHRSRDLAGALRAISDGWDEAAGTADDWRTREKCITVMIEYSKAYPTENFVVVGAPENPMIEVPFTLELDDLCVPYCPTCDKWFTDTTGLITIVRCPSCGADLEPIEYGGIFDGLVEFSQRVYVLEHKTTSVMGSGYFNQFRPNNQITGYIWASSKMSGLHVSSALVNAIGMYKVGATKFDRQPSFRDDVEVVEWKRNVQITCAEIKFHETHGYWPMRTQACTLYGRCEFHSVHSLSHPVDRAHRLDTEFVINFWDYELREG